MPRFLTAGALLFALCGLGCHSSKKCLRQDDILPGTVSAPAGTATAGIHAAQQANVKAESFVIYQHEWYQGGDQLGPYGRRHLMQIARELSEYPGPVVLEPKVIDIPYDSDLSEKERYQKSLDKNAEMDAARRTVVVEELVKAGIADADQRVIIADAHAEGLFGIESPATFQQLQGVGRVGIGGRGVGGGLGGGGLGGGFGGGFGGGGFGGGFGGGGFGGGGFGGGGIF